jgi:hypothetical protein
VDSLAKFAKLLDNALNESSILKVGIGDAVHVASTIEKTIPGILNSLGISYLNEAVETGRKIKVTIKERGENHNIYRVEVPTKTTKGKVYKPFVTYFSVRTEKKEDETDEAATARIVGLIKQEVLKAIKEHKKAKGEGRDADARKIIDDLSVSYEEAKQNFNQAEGTPAPAKSSKPAKPSKAVARAMLALKKSRATRAKLLHSQGLWAKQDVTKALGIKNQDTLGQFALNSLQSISRAFPTWAPLGTVKGLNIKDIEENLPNAKINNELVEFVTSGKVDTNKLSRDAVEAIAAASLVVAATIIAANRKLEG